jgi:hypothetical protein
MEVGGMIAYLAGHGRMQLNKPSKTVPQGVTIRWAVAAGYQGTIGVTRACLGGAAVVYSETRIAGEPYCEHYLCPDSPSSMALRGGAYKDSAARTANRRTADMLVVQPKNNYVVKLSEVIACLQARANGQPLEVIWTVCRSPVGQQALGVAKWGNGAINLTPGQRGAANPKAAPGEVYMNLDGRNAQVINSVGGCITVVDGTNYGSMDKNVTWPGIEELKVKQDLG